MKKLITILCFLVSLQAFGQFPITFNGYVYDSTAAGVPNKTVDIAVLIGFTWTNFTTLNTDANGNFLISLSVSDSSADFRFTTTDCLGDSVIWTEFWDSNISDTLNTSVTICNNSFQNCNIEFTYQYVALNTFNFQPVLNHSLSGNPTYQWTFGDGNTSNSANSSHVYSSSGQYLVCLNFADSTCLDTICKVINNNSGTISKNVFLEIQTNDSSGLAAPNSMVIRNFGDTIITDNSGYYSDLRSYFVDFPVFFFMIDCNGDTLQKNIFITNNLDSVSLTFNKCGDTIVSCKKGVINQTIQGNTVYSELFNPNSGEFIYTWVTNNFGHFIGSDSVEFTFPSNFGYGIDAFAFNRFCGFTARDSFPARNSCTIFYEYLTHDDTVEFFSQVYPQPSPSASYLWDFGDGNSSSHINPEHVYSNNGQYVVCLTYNDGACSGTFCDTISVTTLPNNCNASFTVQDYSPAFAFFGNSNLGGPTASYSWDFGDGNTSQGLNAAHVYQDPGQYLVCFSANDSGNSCGYCDSLLVDFDTSQLRIGGNVGGGIVSGTNNTMILYQDNNPFIIAMDTTLSVNGNYRFEGLSQGSYLIKCIPSNQSSNPGFIPTYWPSNAYWGDATSLFLTSDQNGVSFNFNSTTVNLNGTGSISVDVKNGAGQPLENSTVWIEDVNQNILAYDITDNTGLVTFNNLPFDDYQVWADYPGYFMFPYMLSPSAQSPNQNLDLKIQGNWITTSFDDASQKEVLKIFPNPTSDYLFINSGLRSDQISITDLTGKDIDFRIEEINENTTRINIRNSLNGLYLISIKTQKGIISQKLMLKDK